MTKHRDGFTLIELLVVVAIIALLLSILLPSLSRAREQAKFTVCASNMKQVCYAATIYATGAEGRLPPSIAWQQEDSGSRWWSHPMWVNYHGNDPDAQPYGGSVWKYIGKELPTPELFVCPLSPGVPEKMDEQYYDPDTEFLQGTKFLLWNYDGFAEASSPLAGPNPSEGQRNFSGPRSMADYRGRLDASRRLLAAEHLSCDPLSGGTPSWRSAHAGRNLDVERHVSGDNAWWIWLYGQRQFPPVAPADLKQNAGYLDGHVSPYTAQETAITRTRVLPGEFWLLPNQAVPADPMAHFVGNVGPP